MRRRGLVPLWVDTPGSMAPLWGGWGGGRGGGREGGGGGGREGGGEGGREGCMLE